METNLPGPELRPESPPRTRTLIFARMSTEHQQCSTENQCDVIREYAAKNNMDVIYTYTDDGKSGLQINGRDSLKQLIDDVNCPGRDFAAILVYDISRRGRFRDADDSAYYEYICRRAMAGEYSRELSAKVFKG